MLQSFTSILVLLSLCSFPKVSLVLGKPSSSASVNLKYPAGTGLRGGHFQRDFVVGEESATSAAISSLSVQEIMTHRILEDAFQTCGDTGTTCLATEECVKFVDSQGKSEYLCELKKEETAFSATFPNAAPVFAAPGSSGSTFWADANPASVMETAPAPTQISISNSGCAGVSAPFGCHTFSPQFDAAVTEQRNLMRIALIAIGVFLLVGLLCGGCRRHR
jgi:hypothetical protein